MDPMDIAEDLLGVTPRQVRPTSSRAAFMIDLPDRTVVLKLSAPGRSVLAEAWAYEAAAAQGVAVPLVLATQSDPEAVAIELLSGTSLWSNQRRHEDNTYAWRRVGADLRALHEVKVVGFGPLRSDGVITAGRFDAWCHFVRTAREEGIRRLVNAKVLEYQVGRRLEDRYDASSSDLHSRTDGRLLHGDLEGGHILVDGDRYRGMIDFDQAQAGDPRWDLARVTLWDGDAALDAVLDGYGRDVLAAGDRELVLPLYLLAFVIHHALRFVDDGRPDEARNHLAQTRYERLL